MNRDLNLLLKTRIKFNRIKFEKLNLKHLSDIHEYSTNPIFLKHLEYDNFVGISETQKYLKNKIALNDFKYDFWWAVNYEKKTIGTFRIYNVNYYSKSFEIGYGLNPNYWGKGFFKEMIKGIIKSYIHKNRFTRCHAVTSKFNKASIAGLIDCGFVKEGILKKYYKDRKTNKNFDAIILSFVD